MAQTGRRHTVRSDAARRALAHTLRVVLAHFADHGVTAAGRAEALREALGRTVYSDRLPLRLLADFDVYSRRLGDQVIHELDNWLLRCEQPADAQEPCVSVGVNLHAFVEGAAGKRGSAARSSRRSKR